MIMLEDAKDDDGVVLIPKGEEVAIYDERKSWIISGPSNIIACREVNLRRYVGDKEVFKYKMKNGTGE